MKQDPVRVRRDVLRLVAEIPSGRVTTYGALGLELGVGPRQVAAVLAHLMPEESATLPWHRVMGAGGQIRTSGRVAARQRSRLEAEGLTLSATGRVARFALVAYDFE